jgi:hypothetical protein
VARERRHVLLVIVEGERLHRPRLVEDLVEEMPVRGMDIVIEVALG